MEGTFKLENEELNEKSNRITSFIGSMIPRLCEVINNLPEDKYKTNIYDFVFKYIVLELNDLSLTYEEERQICDAIVLSTYKYIYENLEKNNDFIR